LVAGKREMSAPPQPPYRLVTAASGVRPRGRRAYWTRERQEKFREAVRKKIRAKEPRKSGGEDVASPSMRRDVRKFLHADEDARKSAESFLASIVRGDDDGDASERENAAASSRPSAFAWRPESQNLVLKPREENLALSVPGFQGELASKAMNLDRARRFFDANDAARVASGQRVGSVVDVL
jgi:hypothetical protein|tara:strand:- start:349 stop:894 length:546 start_codon:yes stop_codon:yes gene_type:complete